MTYILNRIKYINSYALKDTFKHYSNWLVSNYNCVDFNCVSVYFQQTWNISTRPGSSVDLDFKLLFLSGDR